MITVMCKIVSVVTNLTRLYVITFYFILLKITKI